METEKQANENKPTVVLGVTGSIAAYKSVFLASQLVQDGVNVQVVMTENASRLVAPLTFMTVSRNQVIDSLWEVPRWEPQHIDLADRADLLLVAPATANIIGKMACGIADDALSTFALSHVGPILLAPAMNPRMWTQSVVQDNCRRLQERGVRLIGPESGRAACSDLRQAGRMSEPSVLRNAVLASLQIKRIPVKREPRKRLVVTAGPTRESIDPVRFISNRSSGRMGYALAECAVAAGHEVVLVAGPTSLPRPGGVRLVPVMTAAEMSAAVKEEFIRADVLLMAAAVADFRPRDIFKQKLKKDSHDQSAVLSLLRTEDILGTLAETKQPSQIIVGFAAETESLESNAQQKLEAKKLDWLIANDVSRSDTGFESEDNEVILFSVTGEKETIARANKMAIAARILSRVLA